MHFTEGQVTKSKQRASVGSSLAPEFYLECTFLHVVLILKENIMWEGTSFSYMRRIYILLKSLLCSDLFFYVLG